MLKRILCLSVLQLICCYIALSQSNISENIIVTDIEGNTYQTISIKTEQDTLIIMSENLKTTKFNNGEPIDLVTSNVVWADYSRAAFCWYNNDKPTYGNTYGALYNWLAVEKNLCPIGWHVPSKNEFEVLINHLGGGKLAGAKIKEKGTQHWKSPNEGATNEIGFNALPAGMRARGGFFQSVGEGGYWWSTSSYYDEDLDFDFAEFWFVSIGLTDFLDGSGHKFFGLSVRCIKD